MSPVNDGYIDATELHQKQHGNEGTYTEQPDVLDWQCLLLSIMGLARLVKIYKLIIQT